MNVNCMAKPATTLWCCSHLEHASHTAGSSCAMQTRLQARLCYADAVDSKVYHIAPANATARRFRQTRLAHQKNPVKMRQLLPELTSCFAETPATSYHCCQTVMRVVHQSTCCPKLQDSDCPTQQEIIRRTSLQQPKKLSPQSIPMP